MISNDQIDFFYHRPRRAGSGAMVFSNQSSSIAFS
jgi:hypothetical protein